VHVRELTRTVVVIARPDDPLIDVASRMRFNDTGAAIVVDEGAVVGLITERELVQAIADSANLDRTRVSDYMSAAPEIIAPEVDTVVAATLMARKDVAHLPVVDNGLLAGVVSQRDLVTEMLSLRVAAD
jgi:CBS domain-containing protein